MNKYRDLLEKADILDYEGDKLEDEALRMHAEADKLRKEADEMRNEPYLSNVASLSETEQK